VNEGPGCTTSMHPLEHGDSCRNILKSGWKEAEELELQVIETCSQKFCVDHPDMLIHMGNLTMTYHNQK
jgi:hypothetical protein